MSEKSSTQILFSSTLATAVVAAVTNPLDVLKVRVQNKGKVALEVFLFLIKLLGMQYL